MGRDSQGPLRGKLRGRTQPRILRFARGSTTPTAKANAARRSRKRWPEPLDVFIRCVDGAAELFGQRQERDDVFPGRAPCLHGGGIAGAPVAVEAVELLQRRI